MKLEEEKANYYRKKALEADSPVEELNRPTLRRLQCERARVLHKSNGACLSTEGDTCLRAQLLLSFFRDTLHFTHVSFIC